MAKNIVLCCDGTNNEITGDSTNVLRLFRTLIRDERQIAYYDAGVGTLADPAAITRTRKLISRKLDSALGLTVHENFCEAYRFLARTYQPDDRIFLFGFSRGAYTLRALAGAIHFLGLVRPELEGLASLAWAVYADDDQSLPVGQRFGGGRRFRKAFSVDPSPTLHFVGVWDTVSSFGFFWNFRTLPFTANNPSIVHARHALAMDERRGAFDANLFRPESVAQHASFKQVWFAGVHSDVGGGYPEKEGTLSKVLLIWMLREAVAHGLLTDPAAEARYLSDPQRFPADPLGPIHDSVQGVWKCAEWLPRKVWNDTQRKMTWVAPNFGQRRSIKDPAVLHRSVIDRMTDPGADYHPPNLPANYTIED